MPDFLTLRSTDWAPRVTACAMPTKGLRVETSQSELRVTLTPDSWNQRMGTVSAARSLPMYVCNSSWPGEPGVVKLPATWE